MLRTLYYETEPVVTGGFSEIDRARRVTMAKDEFRAEMKDWTPADIDAYIARHYPAYWLKVDLPHKVAHAKFLRATSETGKTLATDFDFDTLRGVTELTVVAPDHPRLLSIIAGACAASGANIVDAQIYTTTDGLALDTIAVTREFDHNEDEERRADADRRNHRARLARRDPAARYRRAARPRRRAASKPSPWSPKSTSTTNGRTAIP